MNDLFGSLNSLGGRSDYTLEEIEEAEKMKKKYGGTLLENLVRLTGRGLPAASASVTNTLTGIAGELGRLTENSISRATEGWKEPKRQEAAASGEQRKKEAMDPQEILLKNQEALNREIADLTKNLKEDFGIDASSASQKAEQEKELAGEEALEQFEGLAAELEEKVYGQQEFIKKLVIAFKRPYVMPPVSPKALNAVLLTGKNDTGKHYALVECAKALCRRKILKKDTIRIMDLGLYTDASMEKLFLQDIYSALSCDSKIILFERFEDCHPSFLTHIGSLVTEGKIPLSDRYVMQNGQLVNVQNTLAAETVGAFEAKGKYLIFVTQKTLDKTAGIMGAPFVNALGDICETKELDEKAIRKIAEGELEELRRKAADQFSFRLEFAGDFLDYSVSRSKKQEGLKGVQDFYASVLKALAQAKLEGNFQKDTALFLSVKGDRIYAQNGDEQTDLSALLPGGYRGEIDEIRGEMDKIVGLDKVKEYIYSLEEYYQVQKRRAEEGLKTGEVSKHMIFTGNPGTGKTTIARIISKSLKAIGVLTGGQLVEVSRADLVGRYVGHTAPLTNKVIASAIGGVLFIDEAYSLYRGKDDNFGLEAIDTLVKGIEDNRDNLIVILAGYSAEMQEFLTSNSGLKSRFPNLINFPDYTGEELLKIAKSIAKSKGYVIDEGADPALLSYFNAVQLVRAKDAGNGRLARNKIEEAILNQSRRLTAEPEADLSLLVSGDFELDDILSDEK